MKKRRGKNILLAISIIFGIFLICSIVVYATGVKSTNGWHPASSFVLKIDGVDRTLDYAITNNLLNGMNAYTPSLLSSIPNPGHSAGLIWVSVNGDEKNLFNSLSAINELCGSSSVPYSSVPSTSSAYHLANQIEVSTGVSFQDKIDSGVFCCVPKTCADSLGDNPAFSDGCDGLLSCCDLNNVNKPCGPTGCGGKYLCDGTCSISVANYGVSCGGGGIGNSCTIAGTIGCSGSCEGITYLSPGADCTKCVRLGNVVRCISGTCSTGGSCSTCAFGTGSDCGSCGGKLQCDGRTCSIPTPADYGASCGPTGCKGKIQCDGTCSIPEITNYGDSCGGTSCINAGTIGCDGTCKGTTPKPIINGEWSNAIDLGCNAICTSGKCSASGSVLYSKTCLGTSCGGICPADSNCAAGGAGAICTYTSGSCEKTCQICTYPAFCYNTRCCTPSCPNPNDYACGDNFVWDNNGCGGSCGMISGTKCGGDSFCFNGKCCRTCTLSPGCNCVSGVCEYDYGQTMC